MPEAIAAHRAECKPNPIYERAARVWLETINAAPGLRPWWRWRKRRENRRRGLDAQAVCLREKAA